MSQVTDDERKELARQWVDGAAINELSDEFDRTTKTVSKNIRKFLGVESLRNVDREKYQDMFDDEPEQEPDESDHPEPQQSNPEPQQPKESSTRVSGGQHMAPPRPEHYFDSEPDEPDVTPFDVFKTVVEMFPNYGSNVNDQQVQRYLIDRAEYIGTAPTPGQLSDWLADSPGVSDNTAAAVKEHYVEALDGQVQQGRLSPQDIKEVYAPGSAQSQQQQPQESRGGSSEAERRLRRTASQEPQQSQQPNPGTSQAEERLMRHAAQQPQQEDVPQHVERKLNQANLDPQVREAMRDMYMLGKEESQTQPDRPQRNRREASRDELKDRIRMLEAQIEQGSEETEFTDFLDQLTTIEQQLDQLRGNDSPDQNMQRLEERIEGLYHQLDDGGTQDDSGTGGIANVIASAPGMEPGEKAEVLQSLQGATADPEVKKEELRLQRHEAWANSIVQAAEKAAEGVTSGSNIVDALTNGGNQPRQPREQTEPEPSPQAREYGDREPTDGDEIEVADDEEADDE